MEKTEIFQALGNFINNTIFGSLNSSENTQVISILATLISSTIVIQILIKGFQVYAGKTESPTKELIWDISIKILLVSIALNHGDYLNMIKQAMTELHGAMSEKESLYAVMDDKLRETMNLTNVLWEKSGIIRGNDIAPTLIAMFLVWISFALGIVSAFLIIVTSDITIKILMLVLPIVIFFRAYKFGEQILNQWTSIFVTNLITVFIVGSIFNLFTSSYGIFIS